MGGGSGPSDISCICAPVYSINSWPTILPRVSDTRVAPGSCDMVLLSLVLISTSAILLLSHCIGWAILGSFLSLS